MMNAFLITSPCRHGRRNIKLLNSDIQDWNITFVDTGTQSNIGERLKTIEGYLKDEEAFLANYTDGLTDAPLPEIIENFERNKSIASFLSVPPSQSFHSVIAQADGTVKSIEPVSTSGVRMNGGFFVFRKEFFDYLGQGEELVEEPFQRLIKNAKLSAYSYDGFLKLHRHL